MTLRPGEYGIRLGALATIAGLHLAVGLILLAAHVAPRANLVPPALIAVLVPESTRKVPEAVPLPKPRIVERVPVVTIPMPEITLEATRPAETISATASSTPAPMAKIEVPLDAPLEPPRADLAYLDNPAPKYPTLSRRLGEQGRVMLRVRVNAAGGVEAIEIRASSGFERLDAAALEAVRHWKFAPARRGRETLAGWALVPIDFRLNGGARTTS